MSTAPPTSDDFGERLKELRHRRVLTQRELAEMLGVPVRSLQAYEAGAMPHQARRRRILEVLERLNGKEAA